MFISRGDQVPQVLVCMTAVMSAKALNGVKKLSYFMKHSIYLKRILQMSFKNF